MEARLRCLLSAARARRSPLQSKVIGLQPLPRRADEGALVKDGNAVAMETAMRYLQEASSEEIGSLPAPMLCRVAWALGRLAPAGGCQHEAREAIALSRIAPLLRWNSGRDLGDTAWACAKTHAADDMLFRRMLRAGSGCSDLGPVELANLLWAATFSKIDVTADVCALLAAPSVSSTLRALTGPDLARVIWALGSLRVDHAGTFELAGAGSRGVETPALCVREARTQCLANILWGAGRLGRHTPLALHKELRARTPLPISELTASLWALASLRDVQSPLWDGATSASLHALLPNLPSPLATSTLLWAHGKVRQDAPSQLVTDAHAASREHYSPQGFSMSLWALRRLGVPLTCADVELANLLHSRLQPVELCAVLWALADAEKVSSPRMSAVVVRFFENVRLPLASVLEDRQLSNLVWAFAEVAVHRQSILSDIAHETRHRDGLSLQASANIAWAFTTLRVRSPKLFQHLSDAAVLRLQLQPLLPRAPEPCEGLFTGDDEDDTNSSGASSSLLGLLWACGPNPAIEAALRDLGKSLDVCSRASRSTSLPPLCHVRIDSIQESAEPTLVQEVPGAVVLYKPPGWEVDGELDSGRACLVGRPLSSFLGAGAPEMSVLRSHRFGFGFVSRLDTPSSGLVLQATSFGSLYDLRIQRELGRLERDYVALCHGWLPADRDITARIKKRLGESSFPSITGRPACTRVKVIAHLERVGNEYLSSTPLSLVLITIVTGRTHQIRCHLKYIGHPVVGDGRYGLARDSSWCPRHFLHRYRIGFQDMLHEARSIHSPLPVDLKDVLQGLQVRRQGHNQDRSTLQLWLADPFKDSHADGMLSRPWIEWDSHYPKQCEELEPLEMPWIEL